MAVTIKDIARHAGVSRTTVSRVINNNGYVKEETREKIEAAIKELNYSPSAIARSLTTKRTNTIGVVVPEINNPFFSEVIEGITEVADANGLSILLCVTDNQIEKEMKALRLLKEQRIEGILITPCYGNEDIYKDYILTMESLDIPIILMDGHIKYGNFSGACIDHIKGAFEGTEKLIKEGHERIAIITGDMRSSPAQERLVGYKKAHTFYNLPIEDELIYYGDYSHESAYRLTKELLRQHKDAMPSAIFVSGNMMVLGCIIALHEADMKIPDDMSVIVFDKVETLNIIGMNISYIDGPTVELGRTGMKMLIETLQDGSATGTKEIKRTTLMPEVILKGSEKMIK
jgi:LacI family transcriptional regulator